MTASQYNKCVDLHSHAIFRFAMKKMRNVDDAKEIVQISFEKLWMKHQTVAFETAKSYLFTTAYNTMIDGWRSQKTTTGLEFAENSVEAEGTIEYTGTMEIIEKALQRISEIQKTVILLRDYEGYSYDEIGEITGLNAAQVKINIFRGRQALKEIIGNPNNLI
jgi:RNA polymerase sigma-70 factor (ECF subfamily)